MIPAPLVVPLLILGGLAVGSFLTVCIHRLPRGGSIVTPRSHCPTCRRPIRWRDNIPVIGYLLLAGRCRDCGAPISLLYPLVEVATPILFLLVYLQVGLEPLLVPRLVFTAVLVVLFSTDVRDQVLPDVITLPGMAAGLLSALWLQPGIIDAAIGAFAGAGLLLMIAEAYRLVRGVEGLGYGDAKMLGLIGAFLGWPLMLVTAVIAFILGALVGLALVAAGRAGPRTELPFGSFLAVAAMLAMMARDAIVNWYLGLY